MKIGSLTRVKNLALLTILEPALFKNALAEEMESIKKEKTRTADLEALMVESGLGEEFTCQELEARDGGPTSLPM